MVLRIDVDNSGPNKVRHSVDNPFADAENVLRFSAGACEILGDDPGPHDRRTLHGVNGISRGRVQLRPEDHGWDSRRARWNPEREATVDPSPDQFWPRSRSTHHN
jgi:hypothetical protein